jgi:hypothetical protein
MRQSLGRLHVASASEEGLFELLLLGLLGTVSGAGLSCPRGASADSVWVLGSDSLLLSATAWRNFQPRVGTKDDRPSGVLVAVALRAPSGRRVRRAPTLTGVWIRQTGAWQALTPDPAWISWDSLLVSGAAREGPRWAVGSRIDVAAAWTLQGAPGICRLIRGIALEEAS